MKENEFVMRITNATHSEAATEVFCKKGVLKNIANFAVKHLC